MYLIIIDQGHLSLLDVLFEVVIKGQGLKLCPSQNRSDGYNNYENDVDDDDDDLERRRRRMMMMMVILIRRRRRMMMTLYG